MTDQFRAMCAELVDALDSGIPAGRIRMSPLADRARALLAQPVAQEEDCPGCEGTPVASNSPCAVCGRAAELEASPMALTVVTWKPND